MLSKELKSLLYSLPGLIFILIFLILTGSLLWIIPGEYNIPDGGYATMGSFFALAPFLLILLIPALAMRSFAEEKRLHTLSLLFTRPISLPAIINSKIIAVWITAAVALLPTLTYVISIYYIGNPVGNLDLGAIFASYIGLLILALSFSCIGVFASSLTSNQAIALILGLIISAFVYFGFDLIAGLFSSGKTQVIVRNWGLLSHYQSVQRGLIDSWDIFCIFAVAGLFFLLTAYTLGLKLRSAFSLTSLVAFFSLFLFFGIFQFQMDWTKEKRYTLSNATKNILHEIKTPVEIDLYLDGQLNSGFVHLQKATLDILDDFNRNCSGKIIVHVINPYHVEDKNFIRQLNAEGINGIAVNEKNTEGKMAQHIIFPWMKVKYNNAEIPVPLLINQQGRSGEENLNTSIEMLEYQIAHAIQMLSQQKTQKIVFLEGHGELDEKSLADVSDILGNSYQIDRGVMSNNINQLKEYNLVVIAGPQLPYTETEKYILDQYFMQGGKILWLINGVQLQSAEALATEGKTISRINDVNLADLLFNYGVRVNPILLQDIQCLDIPVNVSQETATPNYTFKSWYYAPLLIPNQDHPVTKGLSLVKSEFVSSLSFPGNEGSGIQKNVLLTTSRHTHPVPVPEIISLQEIDRKPDPTYFNESFLPVAALLEGTFTSGFMNRIPPSGVQTEGQQFYPKSQPTKMIIIASEEVVRNEINPNDKSGHWPVGYDPYSQIQYGNRDLILNAVNYLTDSSGLMSLRSKILELRLLDKQKIQQYSMELISWNVICPSLFFVVLFLGISWIRKRKYNSWR